MDNSWKWMKILHFQSVVTSSRVASMDRVSEDIRSKAPGKWHGRWQLQKRPEKPRENGPNRKWEINRVYIWWDQFVQKLGYHYLGWFLNLQKMWRISMRNAKWEVSVTFWPSLPSPLLLCTLLLSCLILRLFISLYFTMPPFFLLLRSDLQCYEPSGSENSPNYRSVNLKVLVLFCKILESSASPVCGGLTYRVNREFCYSKSVW